MNPELKQRLIGAAVVTALATIFIPMLFDDPVDKKGTLVSELPIPVAPIKSSEVSANKLPTPASKILNKPNTTTEPPSDTEDDPTEPIVDAEIVDDAEAEATEPPAANGSKPHPASTAEGVNTEPDVIEAEEDAPSEPLDTGVVDEVKPPVKKPAKPIESKVEVMVKPAIKKTEANTPKLLPTTKPINTEPVPTVKPVVKKPEVAVPKSLPAAKPQTTVKTAATNVVAVPSEKVAKPKPPELVRWTIHAGSFGQKDNATALMKTLREQGIPVSIETIQNAKGPMYRLKIGPDLDKKKAAANKAKLDKQGVSNVLIAE